MVSPRYGIDHSVVGSGQDCNAAASCHVPPYLVNEYLITVLYVLWYLLQAFEVALAINPGLTNIVKIMEKLKGKNGGAQ